MVESGSRCSVLLPRTPANRAMREVACAKASWNSGSWNRPCGGLSCLTSYGSGFTEEERLRRWPPEDPGDAPGRRSRGVWLLDRVPALGSAARRPSRPNAPDESGLARRRSSRRSPILPASPCPGDGGNEFGKDGSGAAYDESSSSGVSTEMDGVGERAELLSSASSMGPSFSIEGIGVSELGTRRRDGPRG